MAKILYVCQQCGSEARQWTGRCQDCGEWNSLVEKPQVIKSTKQKNAASSTSPASVTTLAQIQASPYSRWSTHLDELDRVLGGGIVPGSAILVGGDPGIGKSTMLLQTLCQLSDRQPALYVTGEESLEQVALRARRIGLAEDKMQLLASTQVESVIDTANRQQPKVMVIDSIQTLHSEGIQSSPGSVSQLRESTSQLVSFAKSTNTALFFVGHVTKEGALAGPRVLEHMVDTVLYFESTTDSRYRMLRTVKNRFGAVNELGLFAMTDHGLKEIKNPSAIFLTGYQNSPGSTVLATWEGTRPLLLEIQALLTDTQLANPRRVAVGLESSRLAMLLAVLQRHGGLSTYNQDVFANVVSGVRISETAVDLALVLAILSSFRDRPVMAKTAIFGELGLAGEVRPVHSGIARINEAAKHGFERAIVPRGNTKGLADPQIEVIAVDNVQHALEYV
jgi:DNA repair protein RadA/Sms